MKLIETSTTAVVINELRRNLVQVSKQWSTALRDPVVIVPQLKEGQELRFKGIRDWHTWLVCALSHYYLDDTNGLQTLVRLHLEEQIKHIGLEHRDTAHVLLSGEIYMIQFLIESTLFQNERELFGFLIKEQKRVLTIGMKIWSPKKVKPSQFKRGYNDKGHLKQPHEFRDPWPDDYRSTLEQLEIERERQVAYDTQALIRGFLE